MNMNNKDKVRTYHQKHTEELIHQLEQHFRIREMPVLDRQDIREVVLICASGRGGSSLLFRELARSAQMLSPRGEHVPFEKLYLPAQDITKSDFLDASTFDSDTADKIWKAMYFDLGVGLATELETGDEKHYELSVEMRLPLQWPESVSPKDVRDILKQMKASGALKNPDSRQHLFRHVLETLSLQGKLHPGYYDNDPLLGWQFTPPSPPVPPNGMLALEEPPFIPILRRYWPSGDQVQRLPLLLKSSLNAYRLEFLEKFFPNARFKIIHLTRNPAASINGLIDGWLHWGFFSHNFENTPVRLNIRGYSDRFAWGSRWWNFDLFDGWEDATGLSLEQVCARQWLNSHKHILDFKDKHKNERIDWLQIKFEDLLKGCVSRQTIFDRIADFLSIRPLDAGSGRLPRDKVMTTAPPGPARWRKRKKQILPVLKDMNVCNIAEQLDYYTDRRSEWI